jgi:hypothetical protein
MKFTIEIGETQKTLVHFSFNQLFGEVKISVNDKVVRRSADYFPNRSSTRMNWNSTIGSAAKCESRRNGNCCSPRPTAFT